MAEIRTTQSVEEADGRDLWPVYDAVFGDQPDFETWADTVWRRHACREGFRLTRAYDGAELVGFAYGYTGRAGQWWTDTARDVLEPQVADAWLDGHFELVSIGVVETARGAGIGRGLLHAVLDGLPHDRLLLMTTSDPADPARRLYASEGWRVVGPGTGSDTVILGKSVGSAPDSRE